MVDIFYTFEQTDTEQFIKQILHKYYNIPNAEICKSINGKPYIKGDKVFFNATHSKGLLALAVGKRQVGLDCECLDGQGAPCRTFQIFRAGKARDPLHGRFLRALDRARGVYQISRLNARLRLAARGILQRKDPLLRQFAGTSRSLL